MKNILFQLTHAITVIIAAMIGFLVGYPFFASLLATSFFIGRELTQAEYKWIERYGNGRRANMPWWGALDHRVWDFHSWFWNLTLPILVTAIIFIIRIY